MSALNARRHMLRMRNMHKHYNQAQPYKKNREGEEKWRNGENGKRKMASTMACQPQAAYELCI